MIQAFEQKANELCRVASSANPGAFQSHRTDLQTQIRSTAHTAFVERAIRDILPGELQAVCASIKSRLNQAANNIAPRSAMNFQFGSMRSEYIGRVKPECSQALEKIRLPPSEISDYAKRVEKIERDVATEVEAIEARKKNEYHEWLRQENVRIVREQKERDERERKRIAEERAAAERRMREKYEEEQRLLRENAEKQKEIERRQLEAQREAEANQRRARELEAEAARHRERQVRDAQEENARRQREQKERDEWLRYEARQAEARRQQALAEAERNRRNNSFCEVY
jgi:chromosome segregation ATPase